MGKGCVGRGVGTLGRLRSAGSESHMRWLFGLSKNFP
jgi:hypothetical protein